MAADPGRTASGGRLAPELRQALGAVGRVSRALVSSGDFDELASEALGEMREALGLAVAALYLPEAGRPALRRHAVSAAPAAELAPRSEVEFDAVAWRLAVDSGSPLVFQEPAGWLGANPFDPPASYWLVLPLGAPAGLVAAAASGPLAMTPAGAAVLTLLGDLLSAGVANARLREELQRSAVERERLRLAADVHDGLAQDLALALREIALLESDPPAGLAGPSRARLRQAVETAHGLVRARLRELAQPAPGGLGLAVEDVCRRFAERGPEVQLTARDLPDVPPAVAAVALRVLSEALANVEKHAEATCVTVALRADSRHLTLVVEDDGRGIAPGDPEPGHLGLMLMHERARAAGGELEVGPRDGGGTRVEARLPLNGGH
jgi:signal transduction histidine kinase